MRASATRESDRGGWRLVWSGIDGRTCRARISDKALARIDPSHRCDHQAAVDLARYRARVSAELAKGKRDSYAIEAAERCGAITAEQAAALAGETPQRHTITDLWQAHPATAREYDRSPDQYKRHQRELQRFVDWLGSDDPARVDLDTAQRYITELKRRGMAWDTRRHHLLAVRRVSTMLPTIRMQDQIGRIVLDRRDADEIPSVEAWTPEEIAAALAIDEITCHDSRRYQRPQQRTMGITERAVIALGACCGLGSSEIIRLQAGDLAGDLLQVGARKAKNRSRRRQIPLPTTLANWLSTMTAGLQPSDPLIAWQRKTDDLPQPYTPSSYAQWSGPWLAAATGRRLPPKSLRKSFVSIAIQLGATDRAIEAYLGHTYSGLSMVTQRHYAAAMLVRELRPLADSIDAWMRSSGVPHGALFAPNQADLGTKTCPIKK